MVDYFAGFAGSVDAVDFAEGFAAAAAVVVSAVVVAVVVVDAAVLTEVTAEIYRIRQRF